MTPWTIARQAPLSMGILQARILKWVAMPSSRGSSQPRDHTQASCIAGGFFSYLLYLFIFGFAGSSLLGRLSLVVASGGCSLVVCRLLVAVASLVEEHGP